MNPERILNALGSTRDSWLEEAAALRMPKAKKHPRWSVLAACLAVILCITVTAEASSGTVSNLLAPLFGEARTEIVDGIGIPLGVSTSADGYVLTADAIIGDRHNVAVVYTLRREDGAELPQGLYFRDLQSVMRGTGGGSLTAALPGEDPGAVQFIYEWSSEAPLINRYCSTTFSQLAVRDGEGQVQPIAEGPWELHFTLRYPDSSVTLRWKNWKVTGSASGAEYTIKKIQISPVGIWMGMKVKNPDWKFADAGEFAVSLVLTDGTILPLEGGRSQHGETGGDTAKSTYQSMFEIPIPLEEIQALVICGKEFPIEP